VTGSRLVPLGELVELQRGYDLPEAKRRPGSVPVIGSAGVTGYHDTAKVNGPGVTLGRAGASFGKVTYVHEPFWPHNATLFVKDFKGNDVSFVRYLLESIDFSSINSGAAQPMLNRNYAYLVQVNRPLLPAQRRIAEILAAYDELIENCERRIRVLDEMARALYREWFVLFRYPGHEKMSLVDSPHGRIPKGWRCETLGRVAKVNARQICTKSPPERIRYIDISSVSPGAVEEITEYDFSDAPGRARRIVTHGDVLWSCVRPNRRSFALVLNPDEATIASTGFAVLSASEVPYSYLYAATTTDDFVSYLEKRATGAAYPAVTAAVFEAAPIVVPPPSLLGGFAEAANPGASLSASLRRRIANLRKTRGLLLPRLLSGQLSVDSAA
jgi:type I restriction enzyme, S subunit